MPRLDDLPFEKSLIDCCYSLVVVDKQTSSIRLVHKSLQDFLKIQHDKKKIFETGHNDIARTCITYMSFSDITMDKDPSYDKSTVATLIQCSPLFYSRCGTDAVLWASTNIDKYPFLQHAIQFWGEHARKGRDYQETTDLAINLLLNRDDRYCISRKLHLLALDAVFSDYGYGFLDPTGSEEMFESQHVITTSEHQFLSSCRYKYLKKNGETPLSRAAVLGNVKLVRQLLTNNANINPRDNKGKTPLASVQSLIGQFTEDVRVNKDSRVGDILKVDYLKEFVIVEALLKENGGIL